MNAIQAELSALSGRPIRLLHFTASHDRLTLKIVTADDKDVYLILVFCEEICVKPLWTLSAPVVRRLESSSDIVFEDGSMRVICQEAHLQKKPLSTTTAP